MFFKYPWNVNYERMRTLPHPPEPHLGWGCTATGMEASKRFKEIEDVCSNIRKGKPVDISRLSKSTAGAASISSTETVDVAELAECVDSLKEVARFLYNERDKMEKGREKMSKEIEELKERIKQLEVGKDQLLLGQISLKLEKELMRRVVAGVPVEEEILRNMTWSKMEKAIEGVERRGAVPILESQTERDTAKRHWYSLEKKYGITSADYDSIDVFKTTRNYAAHPGGSLDVARRLLLKANEMAPGDKKIGLKFLTVLTNMDVDNIST